MMGSERAAADTGRLLSRRTALGGALSVAALAALEACSGTSGQSGLPAAAKSGAAPAKFNFSTWGDYRFYQDGFAAMQQAVPKYRSTKFSNQQATDSTVLSARLLSSYVAKAYATMPDVCELAWSDIPRLSDAGVLVDLTERFAPYKDEVSKATLDAVSYQGKVMGCPWRPNTILMWYRDDVWKEAGVDAASIKVWDDFVAAGHQLQAHKYADGKKRYIVGVEPNATFNNFLYVQQGGNLFDAATGKLTAFAEDPRFRAAFALQVQWAQSGGVGLQIASYSPSWFKALDDGLLSCVVTGSWMDQMLQQNVTKSAGKWKVAALPAFAAGDTGQALDGAAAVGVVKKPGADADLAWDFLQKSFYDKAISPPLYDKWHLNPCYQPAAKQVKYHQPSSYYGGQNVGALDDTVQKAAHAPVGSPDYALLMNLIGAELGSAAAGKKSVDAAISSAYAAAQAKKVGA